MGDSDKTEARRRFRDQEPQNLEQGLLSEVGVALVLLGGISMGCLVHRGDLRWLLE